ncbi:MAG: type VI secretion system protein ImpA [Lentisphaeria bacterium]|jgi:type VI secretion system protein ImpA
MASPDLIDIESLLQPFTGDIPSGLDIRSDISPTSPYQMLRSQREQARAVERQSVHDGNSNEASEHWRQVAEISPGIFRDKSKDLEVACWYAEAMVRRNGFAGLRDSFRLIEGLIDRFWDTLFPIPDEYGIETRVTCLAGLCGDGGLEGSLIAPIRKVTITEGDYPGPFSFWQYHQANDAENTIDERSRKNKIENLGFSLKDIDKSVDGSTQDFFVNQRSDLSECIDCYRSISTKLDNLCGLEDAPPTRKIIEVLDECLLAVNFIGKQKFPVAAEENEDIEESSDTIDSPEATKTNTRGPVATRDDAFKQLLLIADFFRKTEPHSPVSYILQKAVKWGNMPLTELISELIDNDDSRRRYSELTGVEEENT